MNRPPTVGELVAALRHDRDAFARVEQYSTDRTVALLAGVNARILDRLLERVDAPHDATQPRDVSRREGFA